MNIFNAISKLFESSSSNPTPLQIACAQGDLATAKTLLEQGADVNACSPAQEFSPLFLAVKQCNEELVVYLLDHGADINLGSAKRPSPLQIAISLSAARNIIGILVDRGADVNHGWQGQYMYQDCLCLCDRELRELLLKHGARYELAPNTQGDTRLHFGNQAYWLELGFGKQDVNTKNYLGWTPLYKADTIEDIRALVQNGADINATDAKGVTILEHFMGQAMVQDIGSERYKKCLAKVEELFDLGMDANTRGKYGWTPMHTVAFSGHIPLMELLLARGANLNLQENEEGDTPLHTVGQLCENASERVAARKWLLDHGADPNIVNKKGRKSVLPAK